MLDCRRWGEIEISLTGTTTTIFRDHIDITQYTSNTPVSYIVYPEIYNFTGQDIGSEIVVKLYVINTSEKTSKCKVFFKLRGMIMHKFTESRDLVVVYS